MNRALIALYRLSDRLNACARVIAGLCFFAMFLVVMLQVIARYIFDSPPFWTEELARWLMIWGGLLGASVGFRTRTDPAMIHPSPDNLRRQRIQVLSRFVAAWVFFLPVIYFSWPFLLRQIARPSEGLEISTAWMASALPVAAIVICLHALAGLGALISPDLLDKEVTAARAASDAHKE
jgi:TRAP-type C4-dicarboxylate transport system permease small subunit